MVAQDLARSTYLVGLGDGSSLSGTARSLGIGGYELSDGKWVSFEKWYRSTWVDIGVDMLTQLDDDFGILWGATTGDRGEKFIIDPSFKLGFIAQAQPRPQGTLSLTVTTTIGGNFSELPCQADYGALGGVQAVNCRLAASILAPADTLQYLVNLAPSRLNIRLSYIASF